MPVASMFSYLQWNAIKSHVVLLAVFFAVLLLLLIDWTEIMRNINKVLFAAVALLGINAAAYADILAAGAMYGGPTQVEAVCYLYNAGAGPVSIVGKSIFREPNVAVPLGVVSTVGCGASLAPGNSCVILATVVSNAAHSCRFIVSPSGADVRGTFEMRDGTSKVLSNVELR